MDSGIQRPDVTDGRTNILFKDLRAVWRNFGGQYDTTNTILVDDSSTNFFFNLDHTTLYANPFSIATKNTDTFLLQVLWPYLSRVAQARDAYQFLKVNTPKWSNYNLKLFSKNDSICCQLLYN
jgi:hypothetical protein